MNVLFLDIDGVLVPEAPFSCYSNVYQYEDGEFDESCLECLKEIMNTFPNNSLVLSSDWRRSPERRQTVRRVLENHGISSFIDCTPETTCYDWRGRVNEICMWLNEHIEGLNKWVVVDDMLMHFDRNTVRDIDYDVWKEKGLMVHVDRFQGLQDEDVIKILEHFS